MIEINDLYKFVFKVNDGSGICLKFEDERKCYILTAYHCIKDSIIQKEKIELWNYKKISIPQKEKVYCNEDKDIALIEIDFIEDLLTISFEDEILPDDEVTFIGYPKKADSDRKRLNGKIIEWNDKQAINVEEHINGALTEDEKTVEVFSGFSGSGVFRKRGQKLTLVGLLKSLPEEDFDYKEITCISIEDIREFLDNKIFSHKYKVNKEVIEIIKDGKKLGEITIKTVPITMEDGRILNVSIYPVTFEEYDLFCRDINKVNNFLKGFETKPVTNKNWNEANQYCQWLSKKINKKCTLINSKDWEILETYIIKEKNIDEWCCDGIENEKKLKTDFGIESVRENLKNLKIGFRYNILNL